MIEILETNRLRGLCMVALGVKASCRNDELRKIDAIDCCESCCEKNSVGILGSIAAIWSVTLPFV